MILIKAFAIVSGLSAAAMLTLEQITPDTLLAIICFFV